MSYRSRLLLVICLLLAGSTFAVYWPMRHHEFLNWDDLTYLEQNDHVRGGVTWEGVAWAFTHSYSSNWHPVTWLSHMLDCQLYGLRPTGHHVTNLVFHTANAILLFLLLRRLTGALWQSALVAALFALHPLHVESVAWVAERKDVLSTFFFMLTLWAYARYAEGRGARSEGRCLKSEILPQSGTKSETNPNSRKSENGEGTAGSPQSAVRNPQSALWVCLALAFFALGLMSKPMLVTLPFVLLLLDYWPLRRLQRSMFDVRCSTFPIRTRPSTLNAQPSTILPLLREKLPFFLLSAASCIITILAQKKGGAVASFEMLPFGARLENAALAYCQYLARFFWPANLSPIYPHSPHLDPMLVAGTVLLLVLLTAATWHWRARFPFILVGWLWFLGTLVPVIGIVQVGSQAFADRYTYIPLIGIMLAVVWLAAECLSRTQRPPMDTDAHKSRCPRLLPFLPSGFSNLFRISSRFAGGFRISGRPGLCSSVVKPLVLIALSVATLGVLGWRTREQLAFWQDTSTLFGHALALDPDNVQALYGLGSDLVDRGHVEEGKPLLEKAISLQPQYPEALGTMGNLLDSQGKYADAIQFYEAALKAPPNQAGVLNNLAWLRASCVDPAFRNGPEAVRLATRACELTGYAKPLFIGTLAAAQAEAGDFSSAIATAQRAEALANALHLDDIASKNRELIGLYRQGKAARQ